eukprot:GHVL01043118.1.p1 GENE.GHVL01043118.1~~GHVL01043118.1.p1  ORF type:complete len:1255 (+),score=350.75 GHVL01043118.1:3508-7272(+)
MTVKLMTVTERFQIIKYLLTDDEYTLNSKKLYFCLGVLIMFLRNNMNEYKIIFELYELVDMIIKYLFSSKVLSKRACAEVIILSLCFAEKRPKMTDTCMKIKKRITKIIDDAKTDQKVRVEAFLLLSSISQNIDFLNFKSYIIALTNTMTNVIFSLQSIHHSLFVYENVDENVMKNDVNVMKNHENINENKIKNYDWYIRDILHILKMIKCANYDEIIESQIMWILVDLVQINIKKKNTELLQLTIDIWSDCFTELTYIKISTDICHIKIMSYIVDAELYTLLPECCSSNELIDFVKDRLVSENICLRRASVICLKTALMKGFASPWGNSEFDDLLLQLIDWETDAIVLLHLRNLVIFRIRYSSDSQKWLKKLLQCSCISINQSSPIQNEDKDEDLEENLTKNNKKIQENMYLGESFDNKPIPSSYIICHFGQNIDDFFKNRSGSFSSSTRCFAIRCIIILLDILEEPAHFDSRLADKKQEILSNNKLKSPYLVHHIEKLILGACNCVTGTASVRERGLELLSKILLKFRSAIDRELEDEDSPRGSSDKTHSLVQFEAQILSSLRSGLKPVNPPRIIRLSVIIIGQILVSCDPLPVSNPAKLFSTFLHSLQKFGQSNVDLKRLDTPGCQEGLSDNENLHLHQLYSLTKIITQSNVSLILDKITVTENVTFMIGYFLKSLCISLVSDNKICKYYKNLQKNIIFSICILFEKYSNIIIYFLSTNNDLLIGELNVFFDILLGIFIAYLSSKSDHFLLILMSLQCILLSTNDTSDLKTVTEEVTNDTDNKSVIEMTNDMLDDGMISELNNDTSNIKAVTEITNKTFDNKTVIANDGMTNETLDNKTVITDDGMTVLFSRPQACNDCVTAVWNYYKVIDDQNSSAVFIFFVKILKGWTDTVKKNEEYILKKEAVNLLRLVVNLSFQLFNKIIKNNIQTEESIDACFKMVEIMFCSGCDLNQIDWIYLTVNIFKPTIESFPMCFIGSQRIFDRWNKLQAVLYVESNDIRYQSNDIYKCHLWNACVGYETAMINLASDNKERLHLALEISSINIPFCKPILNLISKVSTDNKIKLAVSESVTVFKSFCKCILDLTLNIIKNNKNETDTLNLIGRLLCKILFNKNCRWIQTDVLLIIIQINRFIEDMKPLLNNYSNIQNIIIWSPLLLFAKSSKNETILSSIVRLYLMIGGETAIKSSMNDIVANALFRVGEMYPTIFKHEMLRIPKTVSKPLQELMRKSYIKRQVTVTSSINSNIQLKQHF